MSPVLNYRTSMTIVNKHLYGIIIASFASVALLLSSCDENADKSEQIVGKPTVKHIRCLSYDTSYANDSLTTQFVSGQLVTSAFPGSSIAIVGENMRSVREIWFNDLQATLNLNTLTENVLVSSVPKESPTVISDKIYMITLTNDTITYDFKINY